jgi:hypothetical protein
MIQREGTDEERANVNRAQAEKKSRNKRCTLVNGRQCGKGRETIAAATKPRLNRD